MTLALVGARGLTWPQMGLAGLAALLVAAAGLRFADPFHAVIAALYIVAFIACAASDLRTSRLPNAIVYPSMLLALLVATFMPDSDLLSSLAGGGLGAGFLLAVAIVSRGGLGMGDVKLAAFAGLALGLRFVVPALLIAAVLGAVVGAVLLASGAKRRGDAMPYAPFIATGALAVLFWRGAVFESL